MPVNNKPALIRCAIHTYLLSEIRIERKANSVRDPSFKPQSEQWGYVALRLDGSVRLSVSG